MFFSTVSFGYSLFDFKNKVSVLEVAIEHHLEPLHIAILTDSSKWYVYNIQR